jgi:hypothetical protein
VDDGRGVAWSALVGGLFGGEGVAAAFFGDSGVGAFASAGGDAFEDFGDRVRVRLVEGFGGKIPPGW